MGRPPIGKKPMSAAERQRRSRAARKASKPRQKARAEPQEPRQRAIREKPIVVAWTMPDAPTVNVRHLALYPLPVAAWIRRKIGGRATHLLIDALRTALRDPVAKDDYDPIPD
jgi:hypothetical protein